MSKKYPQTLHWRTYINGNSEYKNVFQNHWPLKQWKIKPIWVIINTIHQLGFPSDSDGKENACNAEDPGSMPGLGRSPGEGNGSPL